MAKQSGLDDRLLVDGRDISGEVGSLGNIGGGPAALELTGINKSAFERVGGLRDGRIEFSSFFNTASGAFPLLKTLPTADRVVSYLRGVALGNQGACEVAKQINYDPTRGNDGSLIFGTEALANGFGVEWGRQLTAGLRSDSGATNGTGVDFVAASSFGLQAYLHVSAFTGTSATIKIQESSNDGAGDAYADVAGGTFTVVTGSPTSERIQTARALAVERWLRVVTTGTFSLLTFSVVVTKNETSVVF